jgi:bifunctional non-homologous end joining protein LigD
MALAFPIDPMRAVSGELPRDEERWAFEVKWDGYRTIAFVDDDRLRLQSSRGLDVTGRYPELRGLVGGVGAGRAIIDGEVVVLDDQGRPRFELLQRHESPAVYVAFDLLSLDGTDIIDQPYEERRRLLQATVEPGPGRVVTAHHTGHGRELLDAAVAQGLEGLMAKRLGSTYQPGRRSPSWRKIKHRRRQELVVGGWTQGEGRRAGAVGALLVGYYEGSKLRFSGGVGSGFDDRTLTTLTQELRARETSTCPFDPPPPRAYLRGAHWVPPDLVVEVAFAEWTSEGLVRQASYLGTRDDKAAADVVREDGGP